MYSPYLWVTIGAERRGASYRSKSSRMNYEYNINTVLAMILFSLFWIYPPLPSFTVVVGKKSFVVVYCVYSIDDRNK